MPTGNSVKGRYVNESHKTLSTIPRDRGRVDMSVWKASASARAVWRRHSDRLRPADVRPSAAAASAGDRHRYESGAATSVRDQEYDRRWRGSLAIQPESAHEPRKSDQRAGRAFVHLSGTHAGVPATLSGLQRGLDRGSSESADDNRHDAQHSQWGARFGAGSGAELPGRTGVATSP